MNSQRWRETTCCVSLILCPCQHSPTEAHMTPSLSAASSSRCAKCGAPKRNGKRSCCARGGAWFNKCGGTGEFDHTWAEGIRACKGFATSTLIESPLQMALYHSGAFASAANNTQSRNTTHQHIHQSSNSSAWNAGTVGVSKHAAGVCVLFIMSRL